MIVGLLLWTEAGHGNIGKAREILSGIGLVPARVNYRDPSSELDYSVMVWEDPTNHIGRYRVHLEEDREIKGTKYDVINFHYWMNKRSLKQEIIEAEPMDLAISKVLESLEGKIEVQNWNTHIAPLNEVLKTFLH
ncbi:Uncharacterised protein [uncultured archaeon]|nr:Uncharacterised protein [uncultured archaeon]